MVRASRWEIPAAHAAGSPLAKNGSPLAKNGLPRAKNDEAIIRAGERWPSGRRYVARHGDARFANVRRRISVTSNGSVQPHKDLIAAYLHIKRPHRFGGRHAECGTGADVEFRSVPGAGDLTAA